MTQDPATLDQLRVLLAIVETGSFSAAGRRLNRVQSAISHAVGAVESQLGTPLFNRSSGRPLLTPAGESVLIHAREICGRADALRQLADALHHGDEPMVSIAVEVIYPGQALVAACRAFAERWPALQLRLRTDTLGAVAARVRDGTSMLGVVGPTVDLRGLFSRHLGEVRMVTVAAPTHALATGDSLSATQLSEATQIVLSEQATEDETPDQAVLSARTWRVHDLQTKRALLIEGLGWGNMPEPMVTDDLAAGRLTRIYPEVWPTDGIPLPLSVVTRADTRLGPAGCWMVERLQLGCKAARAAGGAPI